MAFHLRIYGQGRQSQSSYTKNFTGELTKTIILVDIFQRTYKWQAEMDSPGHLTSKNISRIQTKRNVREALTVRQSAGVRSEDSILRFYGKEANPYSF
jgi:hypothetical protein